jgi:regulator of sigma E protease
VLSLLGFLAALCPLVIFHEFGHYLFAKIFGVKPEVFSVGFGPKLISFKTRDTEWRFSAIPLGGYVKLLGDDPSQDISPEDRARTLQSKPPWQRFFIFFGGPLFNFVLAVLIFMGILISGERQAASVLGRVVKGSQAAIAGFRSGDRVLSVNEQPLTKFVELDRLISETPGKEFTFQVSNIYESTAAPRTVRVIAGTEEGFSPYGEIIQQGKVEGWIPWPRANHVGVSNLASIAGKAGIKTGDKLTSLNLRKIATWEEFEHFYELTPLNSKVKIAVGDHELEFQKTSDDFSKITGLYSSEMFIEAVMKDSPAAQAGLLPGDRLIGVGGVTIESFVDLREAVQKSGETTGKVPLKWERDGKIIEHMITPTATHSVDPILRKMVQYTVGVVPKLIWGEPIEIIEKVRNPITLVQKSMEKMIELSRMNLVSIGKMIRGEVSPAVMGGPIAIGKIAGESLARGFIAFLTTMAMLSVGLGVINLLPVPVLDGGHLMLLTIEMIRGKPLSLRQMEVVQQVGLSLILLLMVFVIKNDIARLSLFK